MIDNILTVCTGNICRSPLAEALLAREMPGKGIASAGVAALIGEPADPNAVAVAEDAGLDLSGHRAQQITAGMAREFDLILAMNRDHRIWLMRQIPAASGKVYLLGHWDEGVEVPDPYLLERRAFEEVFEQIRQHIESWRQRLGET